LGFSFTATIRFFRNGVESFKARKNKVKAFDDVKNIKRKLKSSKKSSKVSWINDVEDRDDFMTLFWWQMQARKRAKMGGFKREQRAFNLSAKFKN
jgi:hypothetical protein